MKTIQITIDEKLLAEMDRALKGRPRRRSAFIRESVAARLKQLKLKRLEEREVDGYRRLPVQPGEFDVDPSQLVWPEDWEDDNIWARWGEK